MKRAASPTAPALLPVWLLLVAGGYPLLRLLLIPLVPSLAPARMDVPGDAALSLAAIANSARLGVEAATIALVPGFALGYVLERHEWRGAQPLAASLWLVLLTPSYLLSTGWQLLASSPTFARGPLYGLLFSEGGIVALLALKGLPFACLTARSAWAGVDGGIGTALAIHVASPWRRAAILARLMLPAAGAVAAVVFIEGVADFGIAATLGAHLRIPLVIYGIYAALARTPIDFDRAARLSLVLIVLATFAVLVQQWLQSRGVARNDRARPVPRRRPSRAAAWLAGAGTAMIVALALVAPASALVARAFNAADPSRLTLGDWSSLLYSACYAFVGATLSTALAVSLLSVGGGKRGAGARVLDIATLGSMAVPGIVLGAAYLVSFNGWLPLYGTPVLLLLAFVTTHVPLLARFLQGPVQGAHANLADAARLHGMRWVERVELVHAPLMLKPLSWGWSLAFGGLFFELPLSSLLYPIGRAPVGVQLLTLDETLRFADEARLALAGIATCLVVVGVVAGLLPRWLARPAAMPEFARMAAT